VNVPQEDTQPAKKRKSSPVAKPMESERENEEPYATPETREVPAHERSFKIVKAVAPVQPKPRGRPKKAGGASQTKKAAARKKKTTTKQRKKELLLQNSPSLSAESEHTVSLQATPEITFQKQPKKQKTLKLSIAKELEHAYDMADITPDKLRAPGSKQTFGGLSRTIVEQFGSNTSESSVLKDLLEQYNEIKTKYHELKSSRMSHVQSMLEEQSQNVMRQQEASEKLIKHWKQEAYKQADMINLAVEESVKECQDKLVYLSNKKDQLEMQARDLNQEIEELKEENSRLKMGKHGASVENSSAFDSFLLPLLTGLDVLNSQKKDTYRITHARTGFSFEMDCSNISESSANKSSDSSDIGYTPVSFGTLDAKLPEYLKEEIYFDKSQVPMLLNKILSTVSC
jgi:hypothetical protein